MPGVACDVPEECPLRVAADRAGILFGAAAQPGLIRDEPPYARTLASEFSSVTPENHLKWAAIHPAAGRYDFEPVDELVAFAEEHDLEVKGHNLIWEQETIDSTPDWVLAITDPDELRAAITKHITTVMGRYDGTIDRWDVVNEPLETGGGALYENHFYRVLGPDYVAEMLMIARSADDDARLYLNEVLTEFVAAKRDGFVALVTDLVDRGVPLDGVGLQAHWLTGAPPPGELQEQIETFRALGLEVALTELDVPVATADDVGRARQSDAYVQAVRECVAGGCGEITVWGVDDAHTWLDGFLGRVTEPLLFDSESEAKPVRDAVVAALLDQTG